jgi:hypothetical protein
MDTRPNLHYRIFRQTYNKGFSPLHIQLTVLGLSPIRSLLILQFYQNVKYGTFDNVHDDYDDNDDDYGNENDDDKDDSIPEYILLNIFRYFLQYTVKPLLLNMDEDSVNKFSS